MAMTMTIEKKMVLDSTDGTVSLIDIHNHDLLNRNRFTVPEATELCGEQLVQLGATKHDVNLPKMGQKSVLPNGSWLENKQIQAAIESRKQLLAIARIEKSGVLSIAEWDEELGLAEVKQKMGGFWMYLGHAVKLKTYLKPEEALFMMEANCLKLTYNDVTVSLQQAYTLLLRGTVTLMKYKVYASLSRVGYRVLRHEPRTMEDSSDTYIKKLICKENLDENIAMEVDESQAVDSLESKEEYGAIKVCDNAEISYIETTSGDNQNEPEETKTITTESNQYSESDVVDKMEEAVGDDVNRSMNLSEVSNNKQQQEGTLPTENVKIKKMSLKEIKLKRIRERKLHPQSGEKIAQCFSSIPEFRNNSTVEVTTPNEALLPRNVFPNCTTYSINVDRVRERNRLPSNGRSYSVSDDASGSHVRRIRAPPNDTSHQRTHCRNPRYNNQPYFSLFNFQRWRNPHFAHNNVFQRSAFPNYMPRFFPQFQRFAEFPWQRFAHNFSFRPPRSYYNASNTYSSRSEDDKEQHLYRIGLLVNGLKTLISRGQNDIAALNIILKQLNGFNTKYNKRLRLTKTFDVIDESEIANDDTNNVIEVINLVDEDASPAKRAKLDDTKYKANLATVKLLGKRLRDMIANGEAFARHRRALCHALKIFNKTYNTELYIDEKNDVVDRKEIIIDSSDSDCVIEEPVKSKKLRNPFNILKRRSLDVSVSNVCPSTSNAANANDIVSKKYDKSILETFKGWLPPESDFGRPEIMSQDDCSNLLLNTQRELFLFDYLKEYNFNYENWGEVKTSFWESLEERSHSPVVSNESEPDTSTESILSTEDFTDLPAMLDKIRIIKHFNETVEDCGMNIDFDVYDRDVANFKKSCPPKPHYRIACIDESSPVPSGVEIASVHAKYKDNIPIIFAIVGTGSINYLQMNHIEIPVYVPNSE